MWPAMPGRVHTTATAVTTEEQTMPDDDKLDPSAKNDRRSTDTQTSNVLTTGTKDDTSPSPSPSKDGPHQGRHDTGGYVPT